LRAAQSHGAGRDGPLREIIISLERSLCLLEKEIADLREAHSREIGALSTQFAQENQRKYRDIETNRPITTAKIPICRMHIAPKEEDRENFNSFGMNLVISRRVSEFLEPCGVSLITAWVLGCLRRFVKIPVFPQLFMTPAYSFIALFSL
jgi:hypothetical protein